MTSEIETFQGQMQAQGSWHKGLTRSQGLQRFRRVIENSDWDDAIFDRERINRLCIGVIIVAVLYFTPSVLALLFLR